MPMDAADNWRVPVKTAFSIALRWLIYSWLLLIIVVRSSWLLATVMSNWGTSGAVMLAVAVAMWKTKWDLGFLARVVAYRYGKQGFLLFVFAYWGLSWLWLAGEIQGAKNFEVFMKHEFVFVVQGFPGSLFGIWLRIGFSGVHASAGVNLWSATELWGMYVVPAMVQASVIWRILEWKLKTRDGSHEDKFA